MWVSLIKSSLIISIFVGPIFYALQPPANTEDISMNSIAYKSALYTSESSLNQVLLKVKDKESNDSISKYVNISNTIDSYNDEYTYYNNSDTKYFDLKLNTTLSTVIDLWDTTWWDFLFKDLKITDQFDTVYINYDTTADSKLLIEIYKKEKSYGWSKCNFIDSLDLKCWYTSKSVFNTMDSTQNWLSVNGITAEYKNSWDWSYNKQVELSWFLTNIYDYRVVFNTIYWNNTNFSFYATWFWEKKDIANNYVELDVTGNASVNSSRIKLQKRVSNSIQPNMNFVLFSDQEIIK